MKKTVKDEINSLKLKIQSLEEEIRNLYGYKAAYEQLNADVGNLRSEVAGYRGAYATVSERHADLANYAKTLRLLYEGLAVNSHSDFRYQPAPPQGLAEHYFLLVGNGRTGSTWISSCLDQLSDVRSRREVKWITPINVHSDMHLPIGRGVTSIKERIEKACFSDSTSKSIRCAGSKLIFDPYWFMSGELIGEIGKMIEHDVTLIHLKRDYLECFLSWKARGVAHQLDSAVIERVRDVDRALVDAMTDVPPPVTLALTNQAIPLSEAHEGKILYALANVVDDLLIMFCNDIQTAALRPSIILRYGEVSRKLVDVVRAIGSKATQMEIEAAIKAPLTKKLPDLRSYVTPLEPVAELGGILDDAFERVISGQMDGAELVEWTKDGELILNVPRLADALCRFNVPAEITSQTVRWMPHKPRLMA